MADKKSFVMYSDSYEQWKMLTTEQRGILITALFEYVINGIEIDTTDGMLLMAFSFIKTQIDRDTLKYEETCKKRAENIKKRWNKTEIQENTNVYNCISEIQKDTIITDNDNVNDNGNVNDNVNENDNEINNNILSAQKTKKSPVKRFVKPTVEEIKAYCLERNNNVDAETFFDFYESKGWKVGNNPMKDWKAAVRTWEKNRSNNNSQSLRKNEMQRKTDEWAL